MRQGPFNIEKIRELLANDLIEAAIDILLANLKVVIGDVLPVLPLAKRYQK